MANTIGWGKGTQNNTNGWGKYQNTIDAGSVYADSYAGETVLVGTSAAFSYSKSSFHQGEADPTPTITGTTGGTFSATPSGLSINTSTGTIDLDNSTIQSYTITYTVSGVSAQQSLAVTASPFIANNFSMNFNGVDNYILGPTIGFGTNDFSISLWINYSYGSGNARYNTLIDFRETAFNVNGLAFYLFENKAVVYIGGVGVIGTSTITLSQNLWTNIVLTKTSGEYKVYFNDANSSRSEVLGTNTTSLDEKTANIGIEWDESFGAFNGKMDEFAIWNTALSSDAVQEIYNATANNTGKALDLSTDYNNYTSSSNLQYWNRLGD